MQLGRGSVHSLASGRPPSILTHWWAEPAESRTEHEREEVGWVWL